jgi:sulfur-carrier protein
MDTQVTVLFFASVREAMGRSSLEMELSPDLATIGDLSAALAAQYPDFAALLQVRPLLMSRNQQVVKENAPISAGDELAFFPPVTGG